MSAPFLSKTSALEALREEVVWSRDACLDTPHAADQAKLFDRIEGEWWDVLREQLQRWDAQTRAAVRVRRIDDRIDQHIDDLDHALRAVFGDSDGFAAHYDLYFTTSKRELTRPVLGPELETVRGWLALLADEDHPKLKAFHAIFVDDVAAADEALSMSQDADTANARFRDVGGLAEFRAKVVEVRDRVHATLEKRRVDEPKLKLPKDFAGGVFRPVRRTESEEDRKARSDAKAEARRKTAELAHKKREALDKLKQIKRELAALEAEAKKG